MADQKRGGGSRKYGRNIRRYSGGRRNLFPNKAGNYRRYFREPELPRSMWPGEPAKQDLIFALHRA